MYLPFLKGVGSDDKKKIVIVTVVSVCFAIFAFLCGWGLSERYHRADYESQRSAIESAIKYNQRASAELDVARSELECAQTELADLRETIGESRATNGSSAELIDDSQRIISTSKGRLDEARRIVEAIRESNQ